MLAHIKRTIRSRGLCVLGYFWYWLHWSTNRITVHWNTSIQSSATPSVYEMHRCVLCVCVECAFIERFLWFLVHFLFHVSKPWFSRSHPNYWYRRLVCNLSVRMCLCVWDFCMFDFCFNQAFVCFNRVPFLVCKLLFDGQRISFRCFIKFFFRYFFFFFHFVLLLLYFSFFGRCCYCCFITMMMMFFLFDSYMLTLRLSVSLSLFVSCFFVCMKNSYVFAAACFVVVVAFYCIFSSLVFRNAHERILLARIKNRPFGWKDVGPIRIRMGKEHEEETTVCLVCSYL